MISWKGGLVAGLFVALAGVLLVFHLWRWDRTKSEHIAHEIDLYIHQHGKLPDPNDHPVMLGLGFELRVGWHPDFHALEKERYELTLYDGFDGPYWIFDSATQDWRKGYPE